MSRSLTVTGRVPRTRVPTTVAIEDGEVVAIEESSSETAQWLAPGLVDLQVNGFAGFDFNADDPHPEDVISAAHALWANGVTTFVPALITASHDQISARLRAIAEARGHDAATAHMVPYVHLEGPHISDQDGPRGAHDPTWVRRPSIEEFGDWQRISGGLIGLVTMSPHWEGSADYIAELTARSVTVSIGHTHAGEEQIRRAVEAGARLSTHLGNGAHATLPRHPNYIWSQLAEDRLTAGLIADGHHLPAATLRSMLRAKGLDRCVLVSDATALAGCPPGRYRTPVGGEVELHASGRIDHVGSGLLAGSGLSLGYGVASVANDPAFGLAAAVDLATVNPGRFAGGRGVLGVGKEADLILFTWQPREDHLPVTQALLRGEPPPG